MQHLKYFEIKCPLHLDPNTLCWVCVSPFPWRTLPQLHLAISKSVKFYSYLNSSHSHVPHSYLGQEWGKSPKCGPLYNIRWQYCWLLHEWVWTLEYKLELPAGASSAKKLNNGRTKIYWLQLDFKTGKVKSANQGRSWSQKAKKRWQS